jgi:hypothetical protein
MNFSENCLGPALARLSDRDWDGVDEIFSTSGL